MNFIECLVMTVSCARCAVKLGLNGFCMEPMKSCHRDFMLCLWTFWAHTTQQNLVLYTEQGVLINHSFI
jgi:hypothetical protein